MEKTDDHFDTRTLYSPFDHPCDNPNDERRSNLHMQHHDTMTMHYALCHQARHLAIGAIKQCNSNAIQSAAEPILRNVRCL